MNWKDWYYGEATEEEREEVRKVAQETAELPEGERLRKRTLFKIGKLCRNKGLTVVAESHPKWHYVRWVVKRAIGGEAMQFGDAEEAEVFCREEKKAVAVWLKSIEAIWLVRPDGEEVAI